MKKWHTYLVVNVLLLGLNRYYVNNYNDCFLLACVYLIYSCYYLFNPS